ncbi:WD40 repeat-like protein [Serendipita vermifera]|nr:WD40 repeat-like protein [Serendipita vermifera]
MDDPRFSKTFLINTVHEISHHSEFICVRFSRDGEYLATGGYRKAEIFNAHALKLVARFDSADDSCYVYSVCFSPSGEYLSTGGADGQIRIWDIAERRILRQLRRHDGEIHSISFSTTGEFIVSGGSDSSVRVWKMDIGKYKLLCFSTSPVWSVAISPDDTLVVAGVQDGTIRMCHLSTGQLLGQLHYHRSGVSSVGFALDRRGFYSSSFDNTIKYWEVDSFHAMSNEDLNIGATNEKRSCATCVQSLTGHMGGIRSMSISPDGQWIASAITDGNISFSDRNGYSRSTLKEHDSSLMSTDFSPTEQLFVTAYANGKLKLWKYSTT